MNPRYPRTTNEETEDCPYWVIQLTECQSVKESFQAIRQAPSSHGGEEMHSSRVTRANVQPPH